jgi:hypothetical protein
MGEAIQRLGELVVRPAISASEWQASCSGSRALLVHGGAAATVGVVVATNLWAASSGDSAPWGVQITMASLPGILAFVVSAIAVLAWWVRESTRARLAELHLAPVRPSDFALAVIAPVRLLLAAACLPAVLAPLFAALYGRLIGIAYLGAFDMWTLVSLSNLLTALLAPVLILLFAVVIRRPGWALLAPLTCGTPFFIWLVAGIVMPRLPVVMEELVPRYLAITVAVQLAALGLVEWFLPRLVDRYSARPCEARLQERRQ